MGKLVVTGRARSSIQIGDNINILLLKWARLAIDAPRDMKILRLEPTDSRDFSFARRLEDLRDSRIAEGRFCSVLMISRENLDALRKESREVINHSYKGMTIVIVAEQDFLDIGEWA